MTRVQKQRGAAHRPHTPRPEEALVGSEEPNHEVMDTASKYFLANVDIFADGRFADETVYSAGNNRIV